MKPKKTRSFLFEASILISILLIGLVVAFLLRTAPTGGVVAQSVSHSSISKPIPTPAFRGSPTHPVVSPKLMLDQVSDLPHWAVPYGKEFWRATALPRREDGQVDFQAAIERVSNAIRDRSASGAPQARMQRYTVTFDEFGFTFSPNRFVRQETIPASGRHGPRIYPVYEEDPSRNATFRTLSVHCGDEVLYTPDTEVPRAFLGNTGQRLLNESAGLVEHYETRREGVEVTWVLTKRPAAQAPLEIEASFTGLDYIATEGQELLFGEPDGTPVVQIGKVTLVDANAASVDLPMEFSDGRLLVRVSETLIERLAFPVAIDPTVTISPAFGAGGPMAPNSQRATSVAWNAAGFTLEGGIQEGYYLVVWQDYRNGKWEIWGARVRPTGRVFDASGLMISDPESEPQLSPEVASNGTDWFVVWQRGTAPFTQDILGRSISSGGVLNPVFQIWQSTSGQEDPDVAASGGQYLVVWKVYNGRAHAARINGGVVESSPDPNIPICTLIGPWFRPQASGNGTDWLVVWEGRTTRTVHSAVVMSDGVVTCLPEWVTGDGGAPAVAGLNGEWLVAWGPHPTVVEGGDISARRVYFDTLGNPVLGAGVQVSQGSDEDTLPAVASSSSGYLVAWLSDIPFAEQHRDIRGARITSSGVVEPGSGFTIAETTIYDHADIAIASTGADYLVTWSSGPVDPAEEVDSNVYAARVLADGVVLDRIPVSTTAAPPMINLALPNFVGQNSTTLLAWEDNRAGHWDIYAARITPTTDVLDVNGLAIATGPVTGQQYPSVAQGATAGGGGWLVVWQASGNILAKTVDFNGSVMAQELTISAAAGTQRYPSVGALEVGTSGNGKYLIAWEDDNNSPGSGWDVFASLVRYRNDVGNWVVGNPFLVHGDSSDQRFASVAGNGRTGEGGLFLVVWESRSGGNTNILGRRVDENGNPLETLQICNHLAIQTRPAVASRKEASGGFGVVWEDNRDGNGEIYGVSILSDGTIGTPANGRRITTSPSSELWPVITEADLSSGSNRGYLVVWFVGITSYSYDIQGARLKVSSFNDVSVDGSVFSINAELGVSALPTVGSLGPNSGKQLVAYSHLPVAAPNYKVRANVVTFSP